MNAPSTSHYPAAPTAQKSETHTLSVLVDNEPGVLARVIGLFSGRGYNIESLTVSETEHAKHLSLITIVTTGTPMVIEQIKNQLDRLVPVHRVVDMTLLGRSIERELAMVKVKGKGEHRVEALRLADAFRARVIDATTESFVFEITGGERQDRAVRGADAAARPGRGRAHRHCGHRARAGRHGRALSRACPGGATSLEAARERTKGPMKRPMQGYYNHACLLRSRRRPEPDQGQEGRHHRLRQPGPRPCAELARLRRQGGRGRPAQELRRREEGRGREVQGHGGGGGRQMGRRDDDAHARRIAGRHLSRPPRRQHEAGRGASCSRTASTCISI